MIACDVLILGGGIQGLWLLHELNNKKKDGFSAVLLEEKRLGERQTTHSHVFLHQGFAYLKYDGIEFFRQAWKTWEPWLSDGRQPPFKSAPAHHVFLNEEEFEDAKELWEISGLKFTPGTTVEGFADRRFKGVVKTDEITVCAKWLVDQFRLSHEAAIRRVGEVQRIELDASAQRVESVLVTPTKGGAPVEVRPAAVILAAGRANGDLLRLIRGPQEAIPAQAQVKLAKDRELEMLVVRGPADRLPEFNGSVYGLVVEKNAKKYDVSLAIVSRKKDTQVVWLVLGVPHGDGGYPPQVEGRRLVMEGLGQLFPALQLGQQQLSWQRYDAPLTQFLRPKTGEKKELKIDTYSRLFENLWVVYPDRLTLAPLVAQKLAQAMRERGVTPRPLEGSLGELSATEPRPEYWTTLEEAGWIDW